MYTECLRVPAWRKTSSITISLSRDFNYKKLLLRSRTGSNCLCNLTHACKATKLDFAFFKICSPYCID